MIFVDTGAWFAAYVQGDMDHESASNFLSSPGDRLITTDFVLDELLTLLVVRRRRIIAMVVGPSPLFLNNPR